MNKLYKDIIKVVVIVALSIIVYKLYFEKESVIGTETIITPITDVKPNTQPIKIDTLYIKGNTEYVKGDTKYIKGGIQYKDGEVIYVDSSTVGSIPVKKYTYIDSLANGILKAEIVADNIYNRKIKLTTFNKETTTTVVKSLLFLDFEIETYKDLNLRGASVSLDYINKNKWKIGVGVGYDLNFNQPYGKISFGIPLN